MACCKSATCASGSIGSFGLATASITLAGEGSELLAYYPQVRDRFDAWRAKVEAAWQRLEEVWSTSWQIADQKQFAQAIQGRTPFTGLLFALLRRRRTAVPR